VKKVCLPDEAHLVGTRCRVRLGICVADAQQRVPTAEILHSSKGVAHVSLISWSLDGLMDAIIISLKVNLDADGQHYRRDYASERRVGHQLGNPDTSLPHSSE